MIYISKKSILLIIICIKPIKSDIYIMIMFQVNAFELSIHQRILKMQKYERVYTCFIILE